MSSFLLLFPELLLLNTVLYGREHPDGQLGSHVLAISHPDLLPTPSLRALWRSLDAVYCSSTTKTLVLSMLLFTDAKACHHAGCWEGR